MPTPAINVRNLTKNYGTVLAVDDVSFQVAPGELVGFLGPNGAGKSTCMRILTTFLPASSGYAWLNGFDVMYQSMEVRRQIGYLPESVPVYPEMRVGEYLTYRARLKGVPRMGRTSRIDYCIEKCRVKEVRNRLLGTLSKGYRQRVGLADTLLASPPILILDEPTSGLDPVQIRETLATIRELGGKHTVLLSTHILSEVERVCDRVIIVNKGRIRFDDTLRSIAEREPVLVLEARGPVDAIAAFILDQPEVVAVKSTPLEADLATYEIKTPPDRDLREVISAQLVGRGWTVRRLDLKRESLEDLFSAVVMKQEEPAVETETVPVPEPEPVSVPAA